VTDWYVDCGKNTPEHERLDHNSLEVDVSDHFPFFSWVMAVGEPARKIFQGVLVI